MKKNTDLKFALISPSPSFFSFFLLLSQSPAIPQCSHSRVSLVLVCFTASFREIPGSVSLRFPDPPHYFSASLFQCRESFRFSAGNASVRFCTIAWECFRGIPWNASLHLLPWDPGASAPTLVKSRSLVSLWRSGNCKGPAAFPWLRSYDNLSHDNRRPQGVRRNASRLRRSSGKVNINGPSNFFPLFGTLDTLRTGAPPIHC